MFSPRHGVTRTTAAAMSAVMWGGNDPNDDRRCQCHVASRPCAAAAARPAQARARRDGRRRRRAHRARRVAAAVALVRQRQGRAGAQLRSLQRGPVRAPLPHRAQEFAHPRRLDEPVQPGPGAGAGLGGEPHRRAGQAAHSTDRHALLFVPAVPHRDRVDLSVQPQCRADQRIDARHRRASLAHLQHLLHAGAGAGDGDAHVPVRLSAGLERAALRRRLL